MRHRVPACAAAVLGLGLLFPGGAVAQEAVATDATEEVRSPPAAQLARPQWVILMAILGEQLPERAVLTEVTFDVAPADARIAVALPADDPNALPELRARLDEFFGSAEVSGFDGAPAAGYEQYHVVLTGVPTLAQYREAKGEGGTTEPNPTAEQPPAAGPAAPATPAPAPAGPAPSEVQLRRMTESGQGGGFVAQMVVNNREYIAREGREFANRRYKFIGPVPAPDGSPDVQCVRIEQVDTGETLTVCTEP